jgi:putative CRISPR-associated protein (TIGR02619 family)
MIKEGVRQPSAELSTLVAIKLTRGDDVVLIGSKTPDSVACMEAMASVLFERGHNPEVVKVEDLTSAKGDLVNGLGTLANKLVEKCREKQANNREVSFVVTGGYKAMTAIGSVVAMLMGCHSYYQYEGSEEAFNIGIIPLEVSLSRLPCALHSLEGRARQYSRRDLLALGLSEEEIRRYFVRNKSQYTLSPLASLVAGGIVSVPTSPAGVPIRIAEASKAHGNLWDTDLRCFEDIPCARSRELLSATARALTEHATAVWLGEFTVGTKGDYRIGYKGATDGRVRLGLRIPNGEQYLSVEPLLGRLEALDRLCHGLWGGK